MFKRLVFTISILFVSFATTAQAEVLNETAPRIVTEDNIVINKQLFGDTFLIGDTITMKAPIEGDLFVIAKNLYVEAPINGSLRAIATNIELKAPISGSFTFIGDNIYIASTGEIGIDAYGITQRLNFEGRIGRNLNLAFSPNSEITVNGKIMGDFTYADSRPQITDTSFIAGKTHEIEYNLNNQEIEKNNRRNQILSKASHSIILILLSLAIYAGRKSWYKKKFELLEKNPLKSLLYGLATSVLTPFILFILLITLVGIPFALVLLEILFFIYYLSPIFIGAFIGKKILPRKDVEPIHIIIGILLLDIISLAPNIGGLVMLISSIALVGLVVYNYSLRFKKK